MERKKSRERKSRNNNILNVVAKIYEGN